MKIKRKSSGTNRKYLEEEACLFCRDGDNSDEDDDTRSDVGRFWRMSTDEDLSVHKGVSV